MTTFLLIRHGSHDFLGRVLVGRKENVHLNQRGVEEAEQLAQRLSSHAIHAVYSSPVLRARETAAPLADRLGLPVLPLPAMSEIDFGAWTGLTFAELESDPQWVVWNQTRSAAQPPGGETIAAVQHRAIQSLQELSSSHPDQFVAIVSHGDVIKAVIAAVLRISLNDLGRFEVAPASISVVTVSGDWMAVQLLNDSGALLQS